MTFLRSIDFCGQTELCAIGQAIRVHSYSAKLEAVSALDKCVQDADRLDALGAVGLVRMATVAGRLGTCWYDRADPWGSARALNDKLYCFDHFPLKLLKLKASMQTAEGRRQAAIRTEFMTDFLRRLASDCCLTEPLWLSSSAASGALAG